MESSEDAGESTLVLIQDAEYELHASQSSIVFSKWGAVEAKGKQRRVEFSISLRPHAQEDEITDNKASVPLVITAPFSSRFNLLVSGTSLVPLLRAGSPLECTVEFAPPRDPSDGDYGCTNFRDQIIIQTRLAKLCIRLRAVHEDVPVHLCPPESFTPRALPTVKAPSFKLFDQIERDAADVSSASQLLPITSSHRINISGSFHPHKNGGHRIDGLSSIPPRQPTPPQLHGLDSRPSSSSSGRTASPRVLEPLVAPPVPSITTAVDNQVEAREVILRLRARRSSQNAVPAKIVEMSDAEPTSPESQFDAKAKAELDEFNALVKAAKTNVAGEMSKAKQELEYYKSLLPGQQSAGSISSVQPLPPRAKWLVNEPQVSAHKGVPKKPAKLPALQSENEVSTTVEPQRGRQENNQSCVTLVGTTTNQETSPVKRTHSKQATKAPTKPSQAPETQSSREADKIKPVDASKPKRAPKPVLVVTSKPSSSSTTGKASTTKSAAVPPKLSKPSSKTVKKIAQVRQYEHTLDDFDDIDPEVDDAPVMPDDQHAQRKLREVEDEDDPMLTMKVPLY